MTQGYWITQVNITDPKRYKAYISAKSGPVRPATSMIGGLMRRSLAQTSTLSIDRTA